MNIVKANKDIRHIIHLNAVVSNEVNMVVCDVHIDAAREPRIGDFDAIANIGAFDRVAVDIDEGAIKQQARYMNAIGMAVNIVVIANAEFCVIDTARMRNAIAAMTMDLEIVADHDVMECAFGAPGEHDAIRIGFDLVISDEDVLVTKITGIASGSIERDTVITGFDLVPRDRDFRIILNIIGKLNALVIGEDYVAVAKSADQNVRVITDFAAEMDTVIIRIDAVVGDRYIRIAVDIAREVNTVITQFAGEFIAQRITVIAKMVSIDHDIRIAVDIACEVNAIIPADDIRRIDEIAGAEPVADKDVGIRNITGKVNAVANAAVFVR